MPILEAVLVYHPSGLGPESAGIPIAKTADRQAVRAVSRAVLRDVRRDVEMYRRIAPSLAAEREADLRRLEAVMEPVRSGRRA